MEEANTKTSQSAYITKENGLKAKEMESATCKCKDKASMRELLKRTIELVLAQKDFLTQISIKGIIRWESSMGRVFMYGLREQVLRVILNRG